MDRRYRIGLLTPSSNTIMEPLAAEVLSGLPDVSVHFGRFRVTEISLSKGALDQFSFTPQLEAAELLTDAKVDVIAWGGTSGGWVGIANDRELCRQITERCGVPATTSTLSLLSAFEVLGARNYALVTPYLEDVQQAIIRNFDAEGYRCLSERHLGDKGNFSFSQYSEDQIADMIRAVAKDGADVVAVYCTNFAGTRIAARLEDELGITILDSVSFTLWHALALAGGDPSLINGWGRLFAMEPAEWRSLPG
mgnify:CR=1 FL=1